MTLKNKLNIDYSHIEAIIHEIIKNDSSILLTLGQVITR